MHEALPTYVHRHVRHLAVKPKKQQVTDLQVLPGYRLRCGPQLSRGPGDTQPSLGVRILHQSTAIEAAGTTAPIAIRYANLLQRIGSRSCACIG